MPNNNFGHARYVDDFRGVLAHVFNSTLSEDKCSEFAEVNDLKYLFRGSQKWTWQDAHRVADAAWTMWASTSCGPLAHSSRPSL